MNRSTAGLPRTLSADAWFTPIRFSLLLLLLVAILYRDLLVGGQSLFFRDFGQFGYPLAHHLRESVWKGEIPLWNPLSCCGLPFLAQWNTMVLYPLSVIYLIAPLNWGLNCFCLLHLFLGGFGMYWLARNRTQNNFAAAVAGLTFSFNGLMFNCLMWPNNIAAFGLMPWLIWSAVEAWRKGGRWIVIASLMGAGQMLSGGVEIILFTWLLLLLFLGTEECPPASSRLLCWKRIAAVALLVAGLSALQLLPFLELLHRSPRGGHPDDFSAMPPLGWANFLVPLFGMAKSSSGLYYQPGQVWVTSYYLGIGAVALALLGLLLRPGRLVLALAAFGGLCLTMALGKSGFVYQWLGTAFPAMGLMRFPIKFVLPLAFIVPFVAASALASISRIPPDRRRRLCSAVGFIGFTLLASIGLLGWWTYEHPVPGVSPGVMAQNAAVRALCLAGVLVAALGLRPGVNRVQQFNRIVILVALLTDVITHAPKQAPTVNAALLTSDLRGYRKMTPVPGWGTGRAMLSRAALSVFDTTILGNPTNSYLGIRLGLYGNCNLLESIPKIDGFYSLNLKEMESVERHIYTDRAFPDPLIDFLGVTQITAPENVTEWRHRTNYLPLITAGQTPVIVGDAASLQNILSPRFQPDRFIYLPLEAQAIAPRGPIEVKILRQKFGDHRIDAVVRTADPCVVSIAQTWYSGWQAYLDGIPTRLWRANHAFQAVVVPPGDHEIRLVYRDKWFLLGVLVSIASLVTCVLAWARFSRSGSSRAHGDSSQTV